MAVASSGTLEGSGAEGFALQAAALNKMDRSNAAGMTLIKATPFLSRQAFHQRYEVVSGPIEVRDQSH